MNFVQFEMIFCSGKNTLVHLALNVMNLSYYVFKGNLITDGMVTFHASRYSQNDSWTDKPIAILNSGGIRSPIGQGTRDSKLLDYELYSSI